VENGGEAIRRRAVNAMLKFLRVPPASFPERAVSMTACVRPSALVAAMESSTSMTTASEAVGVREGRGEGAPVLEQRPHENRQYSSYSHPSQKYVAHHVAPVPSTTGRLGRALQNSARSVQIDGDGVGTGVVVGAGNGMGVGTRMGTGVGWNVGTGIGWSVGTGVGWSVGTGAG
jgi:hypothetical protein